MTDSQTGGWREIESRFYYPATWLSFAIGVAFLLAGIFFTVGQRAPQNMPLWIARLATATFALVGAAVVIASCRVFVPLYVRHADPKTLPDVPSGPVPLEGSIVSGRLSHELVRSAEGWEFRPDPRLAGFDQRFLRDFGIPFMVVFAGLLSWVFHRDRFVAGWPLSILCGIAATAVSGGPAIVLAGVLIRAEHRRRCRLHIPLNNGDLQLDLPEGPDLQKVDPIAGLKSVFGVEAKRRRLAIPREHLRAVQLCPWKYVVASGRFGADTTWAVQGLLVLSATEGAPTRLPILLTGDFVGAARLRRTLADTLDVPYLYCADAEGWKADAARAKARPPLRSGGIHT
jgi:hypothetical protein